MSRADGPGADGRRGGTGDTGGTAGGARRSAPLAMALIAVAGLAGGAILLRASTLLLAAAREGFGTEALTVLVLLALAMLGTVLCAYLALVHALAAAVMLRGADAAGSHALLSALRVLAPRLATRALTTLALTTAAAGLLAGPAQAQGTPTAGAAAVSAAAPSMRLPDPQDRQPERADTAGPAQLPAEPSEPAEPDDAPSNDPTAPSETPTAPAVGDEELPGLGWGDQDAPASPDATSTRGTSAREQAGTRTVVVGDGDSLWSISDDLLGVGPDSPAAIAAAWPELFAANAEIIGEDPDLIEPGQVLTIPDTLTTSQEER